MTVGIMTQIDREGSSDSHVVGASGAVPNVL